MLIGLSSLCMIGFAYLTPPALNLSIFDSLPAGLDGMYVQRFALSFLLLGLIPCIASLICGYRIGDLGLVRPVVKRPLVLLGLLCAGGVLAGVLSSLSKTVSDFYPYSAKLADTVAERGFWVLAGHGLLYLIFYYLPWEFMFRGVLILPLIEELAHDKDNTKLVFAIACMQTIPSTLLHFGHPVSESFSAVLFGVAAGYMTVKTKSILPALVFHAFTGIALDFTIVLKGL